MRAEKFCSRRSQKVSVPTVNSISNDKHTGTKQEKGRKTAHRQGSQAVEVCHGEVLEAKLRGFETEGEKSQPQVGGVHPRVSLEWRGGQRTQHRDGCHRQAPHWHGEQPQPTCQAVASGITTRTIHIVISYITASIMRANSYQAGMITGVMSR